MYGKRMTWLSEQSDISLSKPELKKIVLFDMDGTITPPRQKFDMSLYEVFSDLAQKSQIGIVTGSDVDYLFEQLQKTPTMRGFHRLMQLYCELSDDANAKATYQQLRQLVAKQIEQRPRYRCKSCGFSGRKLYWLCPSCKKWGVVNPIRGLDGE